ncbi:hypothetical protein DQ04_01201050 [Trypanosoma grayi]|uniref:hypothetical protein n=1 Tax=Trypanosoma grayi TaxID=71804 RepID=UPI0004F3F55E|nr:hypothetical protein DQ04_01201050 [Trypanosoma grayi]KEG13119.1 hypothetical protein DQ04_01201050 [Trypanosoma grayi]
MPTEMPVDTRVNRAPTQHDSLSRKDWTGLRINGAAPPRHVYVTDSTKVVSPLMDKVRGSPTPGGAVLNRPFPYIETNGGIRSIAPERGESQEGNARNMLLLRRGCPSSLVGQEARKPLVRLGEPVQEVSAKGLLPKIQKKTENMDNGNALSQIKKSSISFSHPRNELMYNLYTLEMESRVGIWQEHTVEMYHLMDEKLARWNLVRDYVSSPALRFDTVSHTIEVLFDNLIGTDLNVLFSGYEALSAVITLPKSGTKTLSSLYVMRPWRWHFFRGSAKNRSSGAGCSNSVKVTPDSLDRKEVRRVELAARMYMLECIALHVRYAVLEEILFSDVPLVSSSVIASKRSHTISIEDKSENTTRWEMLLGGLRAAVVAPQHRWTDPFVSARTDMVPDPSGQSNLLRAQHTMPLTRVRRQRSIPFVRLSHGVSNSSSSSASRHSPLPVQFVSEDELTVSFSGDDAEFDDSFRGDASLLYRSFVDVGEVSVSNVVFGVGMNSPISKLISSKNIVDCLRARHSAVLSVPPLRSTYALCTTLRSKCIVLTVRLEHEERRSILWMEAACLAQIVRSVGCSTPWIEDLSGRVMFSEGSGVLKDVPSTVRMRNLLAQAVEEKCIVARRCEEEMLRLRLYLNYLGMRVVMEEDAAEFLQFAREERDAFVSPGLS